MSKYDYDYDYDFDFDYDYDELKSHKKRDSVKWIITVVAFVLVFALIGGIFAILLSPSDKPNDDQNVVEPAPEQPVQVHTHWLSFEDVELRTSQSELEQVWEDDGIVFTNSKGGGSKVGEYVNPVRLYAHSIVTVDCDNMTEIVFYCAGTNYAKTLLNSIEEQSGVIATINENEVTIAFAKAVDTFEIGNLSGQVQLSQLAVKTTTPIQPDADETPEEETVGTPEPNNNAQAVATLFATFPFYGGKQ